MVVQRTTTKVIFGCPPEKKVVLKLKLQLKFYRILCYSLHVCLYTREQLMLDNIENNHTLVRSSCVVLLYTLPFLTISNHGIRTEAKHTLNLNTVLQLLKMNTDSLDLHVKTFDYAVWNLS